MLRLDISGLGFVYFLKTTLSFLLKCLGVSSLVKTGTYISTGSSGSPPINRSWFPFSLYSDTDFEISDNFCSISSLSFLRGILESVWGD